MSRPAPSPIYTLRGAGGPLNTLHFSCHGRDTPLLFSGSGKGAIHMWNLNTRRAQKIVEGHSGSSVIWVSTLQATDTLISQGRDMQVCLWDLSEGRSALMDSVWTGSVGFCQPSMLETSPGTRLLAFAGQQTEEIKIIELPSKTPVCTLAPDAKLGMVMCIKLWQPDSGPGPLLLAGYEDGSLLLWDVTQRSKLSQAKAHPEPVMCLTFDTNCLRGISGSSEKKLSPWMLDRQNNLQLQECVTLVNPGVSQLCIRGDAELRPYLLCLTPLVTSCIHNSFLILLLALNKHWRWRGPASVHSLINQMLGPLVQMSAEWSRQQPTGLRSACWGGGGPHKSLHNGSFRKSINGQGERLHNRP